MPHANLDALCASIALEWDQLVVEYIRRTCCSFCRCQYGITMKN
jgi:hypothetical protein